MSLAFVSEHFDLSQEQEEKFLIFHELMLDWNTKVNLISRKDVDNIELHHTLHSLAIAKFCRMNKPGTRVLDLGTGGGFPGIPLAILWPQAEFFLIDARQKKIMVVQDLIDRLGLQNCRCAHRRVEDVDRSQKFDFVVSRAVTNMTQLLEWSKPLISDDQKSAVPNGLICLKGGNIEGEMQGLSKKAYLETHKISQYFKDPFFEEKYVVYAQF